MWITVQALCVYLLHIKHQLLYTCDACRPFHLTLHKANFQKPDLANFVSDNDIIECVSNPMWNYYIVSVGLSCVYSLILRPYPQVCKVLDILECFFFIIDYVCVPIQTNTDSSISAERKRVTYILCAERHRDDLKAVC